MHNNICVGVGVLPSVAHHEFDCHEKEHSQNDARCARDKQQAGIGSRQQNIPQQIKEGQVVLFVYRTNFPLLSTIQFEVNNQKFPDSFLKHSHNEMPNSSSTSRLGCYRNFVRIQYLPSTFSWIEFARCLNER
jgi:hypothetical protein